jgi:hypothetical protein
MGKSNDTCIYVNRVIFDDRVDNGRGKIVKSVCNHGSPSPLFLKTEIDDVPLSFTFQSYHNPQNKKTPKIPYLMLC